MTLDMASYLWAFITNEIIQNLITYDIDKLRYTYIYITKRITFSDSVILHKLQCHNNTWLLFVDFLHSVQFSWVAQSCLTLWPRESQQARPPCPSPTPGVHSNSCPLSQWCHPAISSSVIPFFSCPQTLPASESFQMSQLFAWGGQSIGVSASASALPMNSQDWSPLGWTGWISLQSKRLSRVFSNAGVQPRLIQGNLKGGQSHRGDIYLIRNIRLD